MQAVHPLLLFFVVTMALWSAAGTASAEDDTTYGITAPGGRVTTSSSPFQGSVAGQKPKNRILPLTMRQAMQLGLANNLGLLLRREGVKTARGQRWTELRKLLPNLTTEGSFHRLKESLAITGISLPNVPAVVGPFNYYDLRIALSQRLLDLEALQRNRAAAYDLAAAEFSEKDARELVVVTVGGAYLRVLSGLARVETVRAQVTTAQTVVNRAVALHRQGVSPGIDELRARVELLTRNQQLIVAENDLAKEKLDLIRLIGLPAGQEIELTDHAPYEPITPGDMPSLNAKALANRHDYRVAQNLQKAAESSLVAARSQRLPSLMLDADYGATGLTPSTMKETYHIVGSIRWPIFLGGKIHGDVLNADAMVRQRRDELADLRSRIEYEVRTAVLDVEAAAKQVEVARNTVQLAELTLSQAQERFAAGINDNLEVVQAQQAVAAAHEALISGLYQHNLAKLLLARSIGVAEEGAAGGGHGR